MIIANAHGVKIIKENDTLYARYDRGEIVPEFVDVEINQEEADRILKSERDAYFVIMQTQNENRRHEKVEV
ncbi:hypothetical protein FBZ89_12148 [Nitrospirillum amazonense]|uniref:Uncharacterized protein n=1 Tax=Nitrospirillum amazonense TaxID=28077 RepID=A0A560EUM0_9PROT|nr:hypothetical protein [Nitrospirillum amazonense]TWB13081.1 hypothetical protein FBZ89_12148 [Nitrospirillum amazonense]